MNNYSKNSFTLIELLVVIAIVGILAGIIIISISGATDNATLAKAKVYANSMRDSMSQNIVSDWSFDNITDYNSSTKVIGVTTGNIPDLWGSNHGTASGDPILTDESGCVYGKCITFSGTNYIDCGNSTSFDLNKMTISAWIKANNITGDRCIVGKQTAYLLRFSTAYPGKLQFITYDGSWHLSNPTTNRVDDNKWHNVVSTYDGSQLKIYVDGALAGAPVAYTSTISVNTNNLFIGTRTTAGERFLGSIDEVLIYNKEITASQIKANYYAGLKKLFANNQINENEFRLRIAEMNKR